PARRSRLRRGQHPARRLRAAAARGRGRPHGVAAVRSAARGSPRDRLRSERRGARRGRREVDAPDAQSRRARRARCRVYRRQRVRGPGREPVAGRRAACAALAVAVQAEPQVKGTVVVAFTVQSLYASNAGLASVKSLLGPFDDIKTAALPARYPDTAVETVALADADRLAREIVQWMEGR